jgi:hypothetical protein
VPGAQFTPAAATTDDSGYASVRVTLGTTTGAQTIEAAVSSTAASALLTTFGVTALAPPSGGGKPGKGHGGGHGDGDD